MASNNRRKSLYIPLAGENKERALQLIANLMSTSEEAARGKFSRIDEQGRYKLLPEMLNPGAMPFERAVLRALYSLHDSKMPALYEHVLARVAVEFDDAEKKLLALCNYRSDLAPGVDSLAFGIGDWIETQRMVVAAQAILDRMKSPEGDVRDKYEDAMKMMAEIAPINTSSSEITLPDLLKSWEINQLEREKRLASGKSIGPSFPWPSLTKKVSSLKAGELCTFLAKSKHGKSVLALILAEYMAHVLGYDVALIRLETSPMSIADRIISRKLRVQAGALRKPEMFKLSNPTHKAAYDAAKAEFDRLQQDMGHIYYEHEPGISPSALQALCGRLLARAQGRGRELVVIIDYYQEIDWHELARDETAGYNAVASYMKNMSESLAAARSDFYLIAFAQYGVDQEYGSKKAGFGGQKIVQRSQVVIRLEREDATVDAMCYDNKKGADGKYIQSKDFIGVPMFYHQAGQPSSDAYLNVILANDDEIGPVPVKFINAYYDVLPHNNEKVMLETYFSKGKPQPKT